MSDRQLPEEYKRVLLFYNPRSGDGMFKNNLDKIINRFQAKKRFVVPVRADSNISINSVLGQINVSKFDRIIAAGGDGTINSVVNAMKKNNVDLPLAIFPAGTANDLAHYFNIPNNFDEMLKIAAGDHLETADLGMCNDSYFVNVAAIGSVIDVSQRTDPTMKNALGILAYYLKGMREFRNLRPVEVTVTSPEKTITEEIFFMVVLNGDSAGGFRKLGSLSAINDGLLDVIMFKAKKGPAIAVTGFNVLKGRLDQDPNVIYFQTPELRIESSVDISTDIDGEYGHPLPLNIKVIRNGIRVFTSDDALQTEEKN